jgi:EAL domain-containing protein (putative c-di-GMP-specific phosphodiesterase class I)
VQFFASHMNATARQRLEMEQALRRGLERDQFIVHYQPEVELATGALAGYEALARWQDPQRGLVPPQDFIPAAEAMGLMDALGARILAIACRDAVLWQRDVPAGVRVAVNVSPSQLRFHGFVKSLEHILSSTGLPAGLLELEITEGAVIEHGPQTTEVLDAIARLGVQLAVDDFGTGYSSLGYLKRLPIDKVKIDRSFIADLPGDADAGAIVNAIIALSHNLGLQVVAEGVETQAQVDYLRERGCDLAQGYFFGRPQPLEALQAIGVNRPPHPRGA